MAVDILTSIISGGFRQLMSLDESCKEFQELPDDVKKLIIELKDKQLEKRKRAQEKAQKMRELKISDWKETLRESVKENEVDDDTIEAIRGMLVCTQENLASILGVNKSTIARYEMKDGPLPQGELRNKVKFLAALLYNDTDKVLKIYKKGGCAVLSGIMAMGVTSKIATPTLTFAAFAAVPAALFFINKLLSDNDN